MEKWYERFNDDGFTLYNKSGDATCVYIVRDKANNVNTTDKWIDVISHANGFEQIIVELFPRITHPKYTNNTEYNRYICWHAAHDDIDEHRRKGHQGKKYAVQCKRVQVIDENEMIRYDYKVTGVSKIR